MENLATILVLSIEQLVKYNNIHYNECKQNHTNSIPRVST